jgi:hypothetical protein
MLDNVHAELQRLMEPSGPVLCLQAEPGSPRSIGSKPNRACWDFYSLLLLSAYRHHSASTSQMWKLGLREVWLFAQGHTAVHAKG